MGLSRFRLVVVKQHMQWAVYFRQSGNRKALELVVAVAPRTKRMRFAFRSLVSPTRTGLKELAWKMTAWVHSDSVY